MEYRHFHILFVCVALALFYTFANRKCYACFYYLVIFVFLWYKLFISYIFISRTSLFFVSTANFIVPSLIFFSCQVFRKRYNDNRGKSSFPPCIIVGIIKNINRALRASIKSIESYTLVKCHYSSIHRQ